MSGSNHLQGRRVGLLWMRLGPYHLARARGAALALADHGATLHVAEVSARDHYAWEPASAESDLPIATLFSGRAYGELSSREIASRVRTWLEDERIDVIATNGWAVPEARAALAWAGYSRERRAVVMSETKADEAPRRIWKEWIKRQILRPAGAGLVGGEMQAAYLVKLGIPRDQIFLGYNAVDNAYFHEGAKRARQDPPPIKHSPYFLASARFIARKNLDGLLRAFAHYRQQTRAARWPLVIAGSGEEEAALRALCSSLGLDEYVHWPGFLQYSELPRWYAHAGAFVHPAKSEPWGLVVNEAAASGLPLIVAAPVGSRYELVQPSVTGLVIDPHDDVDIANALTRAAEMSPVERATIGEAAAARVAEYGPERFGTGLAAASRASLAKT